MTQACESSPGSCKTDLVRGPGRFLLWYLPVGVALLGWFAGPWCWPVWAVSFLWMGIACSVNAKGCGRVHCTFTGPLFLLLGGGALAHTVGWIHLAPAWFWAAAIVGTIASFSPEWLGKRYWKMGD